MTQHVPLLKITGLGKSYDGPRATGQRHALQGVDTTIEAGEFVAVIGPSGAGKSTFLRCINRLIEPSEGSVVLRAATSRIFVAATCAQSTPRSP